MPAVIWNHLGKNTIGAYPPEKILFSVLARLLNPEVVIVQKEMNPVQKSKRALIINENIIEMRNSTKMVASRLIINLSRKTAATKA